MNVYKKQITWVLSAAVLAGCLSPLAAAAETAEVNIFTDVKGAQVLVDGDFLASTPVELAKMETGAYTFTLKYKSYLPLDYQVEVKAPRSDFYFQLSPALVKPVNNFDVWDGFIIAGLVAAAAAGAYYWAYK